MVANVARWPPTCKAGLLNCGTKGADVDEFGVVCLTARAPAGGLSLPLLQLDFKSFNSCLMSGEVATRRAVI